MSIYIYTFMLLSYFSSLQKVDIYTYIDIEARAEQLIGTMSS